MGKNMPGNRPASTIRAEDVLNLHIGDVMEDVDARQWVFVGWQTNSRGKSAYFTHLPERGPVWIYNVACADTIYRKFPALDPSS
jgi:hypothetical protein